MVLRGQKNSRHKVRVRLGPPLLCQPVPGAWAPFSGAQWGCVWAPLKAPQQWPKQTLPFAFCLITGGLSSHVHLSSCQEQTFAASLLILLTPRGPGETPCPQPPARRTVAPTWKHSHKASGGSRLAQPHDIFPENSEISNFNCSFLIRHQKSILERLKWHF